MHAQDFPSCKILQSGNGRSIFLRKSDSGPPHAPMGQVHFHHVMIEWGPVMMPDIFQTDVTSIWWQKQFTKTGQIITATSQYTQLSTLLLEVY